MLSAFLQERLSTKISLNPLLEDLSKISFIEENQKCFLEKKTTTANKILKIGVLFSGGPAPGGNNVIAGLFHALKKISEESQLIGFLGGPSGLLEGKTKEITAKDVQFILNTGGFDFLGSGRTKIKTEEQFAKAFAEIQNHKLDGLVFIGGDDTQTNASFLTKYLQEKKSLCRIVGVPKTIDGDLKSKDIEVSFGFDTACKVYSEMIGNIAKDAASSLKYWHFIKIMGRSASHVTLECALCVQPNITLISEEVKAQKESMTSIISSIADVIEKRASLGKNYGVLLIPEGLVENVEDAEHLLDKTDEHGNKDLSGTETEKLLGDLVQKELEKRQFSGKFSPKYHFMGYEGRCSYPSLFDANYCYHLGYVAALLIRDEKSGYMASLQNLVKPFNEWIPCAFFLQNMLKEEVRDGETRLVIEKSLVDLKGPVFQFFKKNREQWTIQDAYQSPGPMQFFGESKDLVTKTLLIEHKSL